MWIYWRLLMWAKGTAPDILISFPDQTQLYDMYPFSSWYFWSKLAPFAVIKPILVDHSNDFLATIWWFICETGSPTWYPFILIQVSNWVSMILSHLCTWWSFAHIFVVFSTLYNCWYLFIKQIDFYLFWFVVVAKIWDTRTGKRMRGHAIFVGIC